jgi:hypothetical protein
MNLKTDQWDKKDYLAFILLYLSEVDGVLEDSELTYIAARLGKDHLNHILEVSRECNDAQCLEVMRNLRPRFYPGSNGMDSLRLEMEELCKVDGHFSQLENRVIQLITRQL